MASSKYVIILSECTEQRCNNQSYPHMKKLFKYGAKVLCINAMINLHCRINNCVKYKDTTDQFTKLGKTVTFFIIAYWNTVIFSMENVYDITEFHSVVSTEFKEMQTQHTREGKHSLQLSCQCSMTFAVIPIAARLVQLRIILKTSRRPNQIK